MSKEDPEFPKANPSKKTEKKGLRILREIVEEQLNWFFRENHLEDDFGIDGFFDLISEKGQVTGKTISFQLKTGQSYLDEENEIGFVYRAEDKHLNYYSNYDLPVIIILIDPDLRKVYWEKFDLSKTERAGKSWRMTIPRKNLINATSKNQLLGLISPITDYVSQMEYDWQINKMLKSGNNRILFRIPKNEVLNKKYDFILAALTRIQATPELILHLRSKIDISFDDFEKDRRELFEISEVKEWVLELYNITNSLPYLIQKDLKISGFLKLLFFCHLDPSTMKRNNKLKQFQLEYEPEELSEFLNPLFHKLNLYTKEQGLSESINKKTSFEILHYFSDGNYPIDGLDN